MGDMGAGEAWNMIRGGEWPFFIVSLKLLGMDWSSQVPQLTCFWKSGLGNLTRSGLGEPQGFLNLGGLFAISFPHRSF